MIELKQLQFFAACVEEGSFSRAAEVLYTSQPNVSKVINELEREIGIKLFERGGRGVEPTSDGKSLYEYAHEMLLKEATVSNLLRSRSGNTLRISFNHSRSMSQVLSDFYEKKNGNIQLKVREGDTDMVVKDVRHFYSDLGITFILEKQLSAFQYSLDRNGLSMETIRTDKAQIGIGSANSLCGTRTIALNRLSKENFVRHSEDFFSLENGISMIEPSLKPALDKAVVSNSVQFVINMLLTTDKCNISVPTFYNAKLAEGVKQVKIVPEITVHLVCVYRYKPSGIPLEFLNYIKDRA